MCGRLSQPGCARDFEFPWFWTLFGSIYLWDSGRGIERSFWLWSCRFEHSSSICGGRPQEIGGQLTHSTNQLIPSVQLDVSQAAISEFHGTEDTILFPSCFDANAGLFEVGTIFLRHFQDRSGDKNNSCQRWKQCKDRLLNNRFKAMSKVYRLQTILVVNTSMSK